MQGCKIILKCNNCHILIVIVLTLCKLFLTSKHNFLRTALILSFLRIYCCQDALVILKVHMLHGREFSSFQKKCVFFQIGTASTTSKKKKKD